MDGFAKAEDLNKYVEEEFVTENYPTKADLNAAKEEITSSLNNSLNNFVDSSALESYVKQTTLNNYAKITDLDDLQNTLNNQTVNLVSNNELEEKLKDYIHKSEFPSIENSITKDELVVELDSYTSKEELAAELESYASKEELDDYVLKTEIPTIENSVTKDDLKDYVQKDELKPLESQITTISAATGSIQQSLDSFKEEVEATYITQEYLDGHYVKGETFQNNTSITNNRLSNLEAQINTDKDDLNSFKEEVEATYATKDEFNTHISDFESFKEEVEATYAKPEDISLSVRLRRVISCKSSSSAYSLALVSQPLRMSLAVR